MADGRLDVGRDKGILHLRVSRRLVPRALRIAQGAFDEALRRGYEIKPVEKSYNHAAGNGIAIGANAYALEMQELTDRVPLTEQDLKRWHRENDQRFYFGDPPSPPETKPAVNGQLQIGVEHRYGSRRQSNWSEGPRVGPLEGRLPALFAELEARATATRTPESAADVSRRSGSGSARGNGNFGAARKLMWSGESVS